MSVRIGRNPPPPLPKPQNEVEEVAASVTRAGTLLDLSAQPSRLQRAANFMEQNLPIGASAGMFILGGFGSLIGFHVGGEVVGDVMTAVPAFGALSGAANIVLLPLAAVEQAIRGDKASGTVTKERLSQLELAFEAAPPLQKAAVGELASLWQKNLPANDGGDRVRDDARELLTRIVQSGKRGVPPPVQARGAKIARVMFEAMQPAIGDGEGAERCIAAFNKLDPEDQDQLRPVLLSGLFDGTKPKVPMSAGAASILYDAFADEKDAQSRLEGLMAQVDWSTKWNSYGGKAVDTGEATRIADRIHALPADERESAQAIVRKAFGFKGNKPKRELEGDDTYRILYQALIPPGRTPEERSQRLQELGVYYGARPYGFDKSAAQHLRAELQALPEAERGDARRALEQRIGSAFPDSSGDLLNLLAS